MPKLAEAYVELTLKRMAFDRGMKEAESVVSKSVERIQNKMDQIATHFDQLGRKMSSRGRSMSLAVSAPLAAVGVAAVKMAMDAVESENLFEVSMGRMAASARAWSDDISKSLGINSYSIRKMVGTFNVMLGSLGATEQAAFDMSRGLTQLAYDMASFYNLDVGDAFEKLQAGISGEVEPLKRLGIVVNETMTQQYAYTHGIAKMGEKLTEAQKVMARYRVIMEQTSKAQGDLARTADSPANKLRKLKEQVDQLLVPLGEKFLPMMQKVIDVLLKMVGWWERQSPGMKNFYIKLAEIAAVAGPVIWAMGEIGRAMMGIAAFGLSLGVTIGVLMLKFMALAKIRSVLMAIGVDIGALTAKFLGMSAVTTVIKGITAAVNVLLVRLALIGGVVTLAVAALVELGIAGREAWLAAEAKAKAKADEKRAEEFSEEPSKRRQPTLKWAGGEANVQRTLEKTGGKLPWLITFDDLRKAGMEAVANGGLSEGSKSTTKAWRDRTRQIYEKAMEEWLKDNRSLAARGKSQYYKPSASTLPSPDTGLSEEEIADLKKADELKLQRRRERAQAMGDEIKALQIDYLLEEKSVKGPEEGKALFGLYEEKIKIKYAEMMKERVEMANRLAEKTRQAEERSREEAEKTAKAFRDNMRESDDAVRNYHANRLALEGKTYEAEKQHAYASFAAKIDALQEEARAGKMVYAQQLNAYAEYKRNISDIDKRRAEEEKEALEEEKRLADERKQLQNKWRREQKEIFEEGKRLQEDRLNLFETITTKIIRITQGEGAARIREIDLEARQQSATARRLITDKQTLTLTLAGIEAGAAGAKRDIANEEGRRAWQDRESWLERQRSKVRWTTAEGMFRSAAEAGARSGLSQPEYVPIKADPAELDLLTRIRGALERTEILTAQQMNALDRLAGAF